MNNEKHITRFELSAYFAVPKRSLRRTLTDAGIILSANGTQWSVVFEALGLAADQPDDFWTELTAPLLTAGKTAELLGKDDPSILYRWAKKGSPNYKPDFPKPIDLSFGKRSNAKMMRWRKAEIIAWRCGKPLPGYRRLSAHAEKPEPSLSFSSSDPTSDALPGLFALQTQSQGGAE